MELPNPDNNDGVYLMTVLFCAAFFIVCIFGFILIIKDFIQNYL